MNRFQYDDCPTVITEGGALHGYRYDGMHIFKGVPYAQAKRFQMPEPVTPWEGVKDACSYGYVCPLLTQDNPTMELMVPHRYWPMDEHCQNLNLWTDTLNETAGKPVLVWLHGGGYTAGSSIEQVAYDGFQMCRRGDCVVVTVNHRLNLLGYLDISPFGEKYANSANAGHADLVAALRWVRDNIAAFGGDPDNVTIFGQSGGGMKVADLMNIPAADGLFHRGIIMSGVSDGKLLPEPRGDGRQIVAALLAELGFGEDAVEKLESVSYRTLADAYNKVFLPLAMQGAYTGGAPMPSGYYLGAPLLHGFTEHAKTIPLMIGSVFGEFAFAPLPIDKASIHEEEAMAILAQQFGTRTEEAAERFRKAHPGKHLLDLLSLDRVFRTPSKALAKLQAQGGQAGVYLYHFNLEFPIWQQKPAWHCVDIPFFFHNTDLVEVCGFPEADVLEEQIFGAVMAFARSGNPNHDGLPRWDAVTPGAEPTMIFDKECRVGMNYDDELLALCEEALPPFDLMALMAQNVQH